MKEQFITHRFSADSLSLIDTINKILDEYRNQNFRLSLRQLYYQLVSRDFIPNTQRSYKNTGNIVSTARQAGLIDWEMIEDRNRETNIPQHWENPGEIIYTAAQAFHIDKWTNQSNHIEVMVEKDALSGVLGPVCRGLDIGITANKGYSSSSTMYEIGKRLRSKHEDEEKTIIILYLGDHDPSGIDMTRDVEERLKLYADIDEIEVIRLALNMDQIKLWKPPENPAKETDARFASYVSQFGDSSWELDAVEPAQLASLVTNAVLERRDEINWLAAVDEEKAMREKLRKFADDYQR
ncbi:MAG: hypothetical protein WC341_00575 [Bacteroidales bacterium]|jgi:hypothetical protein